MIRPKKIAVIGLGDFGKALVKKLNDQGHEVTAIDIDLKTIEQIKDYCTHAVCLDSTDESALVAQGIRDMDLVYLTSSANFETLITTTKILLQNCSRDKIIVRYRNEIQKEILEKMYNIQNIFNPDEEAADNMSLYARHKFVGKSYSILENYEILEIEVPKEFHQKTIQELNVRNDFQINILLVKSKKEDQIKETKADMVLQEGDTFIIFGSQENIQRFVERFYKK
ncbi:MAG: TrkA family potassium uptake protein [Leptospiraceae bacterium]|nr:TrkA family potassium uptake protein [Leptospiraceae bacterium]MDW7977103.1 TrkA family potassium uptake protein [Leptospiraceae bacterium]